MVLSRDEQKLLFKQTKSTDPIVRARAINQLMKFCEPTIKSMAYAISKINPRCTLEDLVAEGSLAVMEAISNYNPQFRNGFRTYATFWISGGLLRQMWNSTVVYMARKDRGIRKMLDLVLEEDRADMEDVTDTISALMGSTVSFSEELECTGADSNEAVQLRRDLESVISLLDEREAFVIRHLYGMDENSIPSPTNIGKKLNIKPCSVLKISNGALAKMRKNMQ